MSKSFGQVGIADERPAEGDQISVARGVTPGSNRMNFVPGPR